LYFKIIGSSAWAHTVEGRNISKNVKTLLDYGGYNETFQAYHVYDPSTHQVIECRDVVFNKVCYSWSTRIFPSTYQCSMGTRPPRFPCTRDGGMPGETFPHVPFLGKREETQGVHFPNVEVVFPQKVCFWAFPLKRGGFWTHPL